MQAFATDIAVYIACPSCSQTGLVDQSTLSAARMRRAQVTLTCHACGERFDATEAQEVILPHVPQETLDMPLTARSTIDVEAETEEPEPRYARASDHEPLTRYQSLHDVWQHLGAETDEDGEDDIVPTLPSWLQKKDNAQGENENAETETPSKEAEANVSVAADADTPLNQIPIMKQIMKRAMKQITKRGPAHRLPHLMPRPTTWRDWQASSQNRILTTRLITGYSI